MIQKGVKWCKFMRMYDIILKKRQGTELSKEEINYFIKGYTEGVIPDYQVSALLMAIFFKKMTTQETCDLTKAMIASGETLNLDKIDGVKVDKHSTGGVGDKTTLVLAPLVASCGVKVAKMSGRGLGYTGGTIDKLESIEGFSVNLSKEEFIDNVNKINIALVSQSGNLVMADKKIYALRDTTATVDNISLIASSVMSKKIASGADAIVLDVKAGDGAFMKTTEEAQKLADLMIEIGDRLGKKTVAVISDMNQPLGYAVGNSLEVIESINTLRGNGPSDLLELTLVLGSKMLVLANKAQNEIEARKMLITNIKNGKGIKKLKEFVSRQGGNVEYIENPDKFPKSKYIIEVKAEESGLITKINTEQVGIIAMKLGAGRATKESKIDLSVGIVFSKKLNDNVSEEDSLAFIHCNDSEIGEKAKEELKKQIIIDNFYSLKQHTHLI